VILYQCSVSAKSPWQITGNLQRAFYFLRVRSSDEVSSSRNAPHTPLPPPFHPELSRPESNNDDGIYAEVTSAQDVQLGEGNYSCQEPLYDEAIPDKEAFYDDIPSLEV